MALKAAIHYKAAVLLLLIRCLLLFQLGGFCVVPFFVMYCLISFLVLQSSVLGRESWLLYFVCLPGIL